MTEFKNIILDCYHDNTIGSFADAKANGLVGIIHKASQGLLFVDDKYATRKDDARALDLLWGAYHFGESGNPIGQARHFLSVVGTDKDVLLCLDLEPEPSGKSMGLADAEEFVKYIYNVTGHYPVIYTAKYYMDRIINSSTTTILSSCPLWVASYVDSVNPTIPTQWLTWTLWQYTNGSNGPVPHSLPGLGSNDYSGYGGQRRKNLHPLF